MERTGPAVLAPDRNDDSIGLRVVSRFDIQVIKKAGVVVIDNLT